MIDEEVHLRVKKILVDAIQPASFEATKILTIEGAADQESIAIVGWHLIQLGTMYMVGAVANQSNVPLDSAYEQLDECIASIDKVINEACEVIITKGNT